MADLGTTAAAPSGVPSRRALVAAKGREAPPPPFLRAHGFADACFWQGMNSYSSMACIHTHIGVIGGNRSTRWMGTTAMVAWSVERARGHGAIDVVPCC
uniref:Uncharacterized protein n=1 Tax=Oryza meridionalis TaxID=40149 RepID=A0A0E0C3M2_9ORYZ